MAKKKKTKKPLQKIKRAIKRRGTEGRFRAWCRRHGFSGGTEACANYALSQYRKGKVSKAVMEEARAAKAFASARAKKKKKRKKKK